MRTLQSFLSLATFAAIACSAAPIAPLQLREYLSLITARDEASEFDRRGNSVPVFDIREELLGELNAREYDDLEERMYPWPGPGMQHQLEHDQGVPTSGFNPVPQNSYFKTSNNVYTGSEVNAHAEQLVNSIATADPWNRKANVRSYPKPSTGFRNKEADNPAPKSSGRVAYHAPINPPSTRHRANTIATPGQSARVGTDRVYGHRDPGNANLDIGVSYHDHKKPIPSTSRNHPFSVAPQQTGGKAKVMGAKIGQSLRKAGNAMAFWKKKGPRRSNSL